MPNGNRSVEMRMRLSKSVGCKSRRSREIREEQRLNDAARDAKVELEKEKGKRRFEERLALDRTEARQHHEQMMMVLSNLQKK